MQSSLLSLASIGVNMCAHQDCILSSRWLSGLVATQDSLEDHSKLGVCLYSLFLALQCMGVSW